MVRGLERKNAQGYLSRGIANKSTVCFTTPHMEELKGKDGCAECGGQQGTWLRVVFRKSSDVKGALAT